MITPITDTRGVLIDPAVSEPHPGSVLLVNGPTGTAWQRKVTDGLWYSVISRRPGRDWAGVCRFRNVVLVHSAPAREDQS